MSMSEVKNGQFVYRDAFFVGVGESRRHPRASTAELQELLLPGRSGSSHTKDQVGHLYEAQLIHCGLPRSKDKNTAEVRSTNVLSSDALIVPANVRQIESDLKKEYASVLRKAKATASKDKSPSQPPSTSKKRKAESLGGPQEAKSSSTKISVKVGNVTIDVDQQDVLSSIAAAKKQKKTDSATTSSAKATSKHIVGDSSSSASKAPSKVTKPSVAKPKAAPKTAPKVKAKHVVDGKSCYGPDATGINQWKCDPCRRKSEQSFINSQAKQFSSTQASTSSTNNHPRPKQTARRGNPFNSSLGRSSSTHSQPLREPTPMSICTDDSHDEPPPPYSRDGFTYDSDASSQDKDRTVQTSGNYTIILSEFGTADLELHISHGRDQMWGTFEIGENMEKLGYLRVDGIDDLASGARIAWLADRRP